MVNNFNILDCTLRDGGYYNNWDFKFNDIQRYLDSISKTRIEFIELGFRFYEKNKIKGLTAYTDDSLIRKLKIPRNINIGVMINTGDLLKNKLTPLQNCKKIFTKKNKDLKFVRLACHYEEIFLIKEAVKWLNENNLKVFVNLMQISEISNKRIIKVCNFLNKTKADVLYFADSLGCLTPKQTKTITKIIKKNCIKQIGIHAHDNLGCALKNSLSASNNGATWVDSTITGMGRGPGNLKTEEILKNDKQKIDRKRKIPIKIIKYFKELKKIYKWGSNKYYALAAKHKIHPTYIQKILSDDRYRKVEYLQIIYQLKKIDTRKYNPYKLINSSFFISNKPFGRDEPKKIFKDENFLILGPGKNVMVYKKRVNKFIKKYRPFVICLNTTSLFDENIINLRVACHPMRIISDLKFHNLKKTKIAMPYSMMTNNLKKLIKIKKNRILDYGLSIKYNSKIKIMKRYCTLPTPLAIGYCLSMLISSGLKDKKIFLAGFDGFNKTSSDMDETDEIIRSLKKKLLNNKLRTLTPSKYRSLLKF